MVCQFVGLCLPVCITGKLAEGRRQVDILYVYVHASKTMTSNKDLYARICACTQPRARTP